MSPTPVLNRLIVSGPPALVDDCLRSIRERKEAQPATSTETSLTPLLHSSITLEAPLSQADDPVDDRDDEREAPLVLDFNRIVPLAKAESDEEFRPPPLHRSPCAISTAVNVSLQVVGVVALVWLSSQPSPNPQRNLIFVLFFALLIGAFVLFLHCLHCCTTHERSNSRYERYVESQWGTPYPAQSTVQHEDGSITFETAQVPSLAISALSFLYPSLTFTLEFDEDDDSQTTGCYVWREGRKVADLVCRGDREAEAALAIRAHIYSRLEGIGEEEWLHFHRYEEQGEAPADPQLLRKWYDEGKAVPPTALDSSSAPHDDSDDRRRRRQWEEQADQWLTWTTNNEPVRRRKLGHSGSTGRRIQEEETNQRPPALPSLAPIQPRASPLRWESVWSALSSEQERAGSDPRLHFAVLQLQRLQVQSPLNLNSLFPQLSIDSPVPGLLSTDRYRAIILKVNQLIDRHDGRLYHICFTAPLSLWFGSFVSVFVENQLGSRGVVSVVMLVTGLIGMCCSPWTHPAIERGLRPLLLKAVQSHFLHSSHGPALVVLTIDRTSSDADYGLPRLDAILTVFAGPGVERLLAVRGHTGVAQPGSV